MLMLVSSTKKFPLSPIEKLPTPQHYLYLSCQLMKCLFNGDDILSEGTVRGQRGDSSIDIV